MIYLSLYIHLKGLCGKVYESSYPPLYLAIFTSTDSLTPFEHSYKTLACSFLMWMVKIKKFFKIK